MTANITLLVRIRSRVAPKIRTLMTRLPTRHTETTTVSSPSVRHISSPFSPPLSSCRQEEVQYKAVEDLHRLLQLSTGSRYSGREDFLHAWRPLARAPEHGADQAHNETNRYVRHCVCNRRSPCVLEVLFCVLLCANTTALSCLSPKLN